ncbi:MAG TPA: chemotaxis response regulator protein-glutamate methylesterase [Firmicutes bacterium]|uniref:Protein-glutamate methylesterase/protein-glutamine glutaminase n=1 Tax=Capillibacterium thermochitinicola TaxID=2699427 RepID=A0A8J6LJ24_9FIRM|nr:chemotaxis response regulator protein-glutamate methylesterase [Capillibacterium thermochitinicola]MBA2133336.1 chemotaxis response regulator protein-glutamate methylesterase [Capillibacterium thermochitinicola]HHW12238.1 chemotaxis response regulator protein-glutamate methylesterase [Bacillota bacterium]
MKKRTCRVLVVDDSAFIRQYLKEIINQTEDLEVVGTAADPLKAIQILKKTDVDVITLDVEMPNMDGLDFLRYLMKFRPLPVVMISSWTQANSDIAVQALALGAVDVVAKPTLGLLSGMEKIKTEIIEKIRTAAQASIVRSPLVAEPPASPDSTALLVKSDGLKITTDKIVAIGASTGGTVALTEICKQLHPDVPGLLIIQHLPAMFTSSFANSLNQIARIRVKEAEDGELITSGLALIVPGDRSLTIQKSGAKYVAKLGPKLKDSIYNPSINHTLFSVAQVAGVNAMGIILTGMGDDGAAGLRAMREKGAYTICQDEKTSVIYGMPQKAWENKAAVKQVPLSKIAEEIHRWAGIK